MALSDPVDADGDQHRAVGNDTDLPDTLITGIEDQVGVRLVQPPSGKFGQRRIQALVDRADGARREAVSAEFFGDGGDLAGGDTLDVHFGQRRDQRFLAPGVALEQARGEFARAVARDAQLELADRRLQVAPVVAGPVTLPAVRPLTRGPPRESRSSRLPVLPAALLSSAP